MFPKSTNPIKPPAQLILDVEVAVTVQLAPHSVTSPVDEYPIKPPTIAELASSGALTVPLTIPSA